MEKVRKAINRHDLFLWLCITQSVYTRIVNGLFDLSHWVVLCLQCCTTGFRLKVNVGRRCWTSTGPKPRSWKGIFFSLLRIMTPTLQFCIKELIRIIYSLQESGAGLGEGCIIKLCICGSVLTVPSYPEQTWLPQSLQKTAVASGNGDHCKFWIWSILIWMRVYCANKPNAHLLWT